VTWLEVVKAAFGLPTDTAAFRKVAGERTPPSKRIRELWVKAGRRGGKSRMSAALAVYFACFVEHSLAPGETGYVLVLASSRDQAGTVLNYTRAFLEASPVLAQEIDTITASEIRLRSGIVISVHANSFRTVRGRTLLACIFDEVAWWRDEESATPDVEVYRAVMPALMTTSGMLVAISTPYRRNGLLFRKWRDHFGKDDDSVLVVEGASTLFNPSLSTSDIERALVDDPEGNRAEWEAEWRTDIAALFDDNTIDAAIGDRPLELPPRKDFRYVAFVDASAGRHDAFTISISHREGESHVVDLVRGVGGGGQTFDPDTVAIEFAALTRDYKCIEIVGDNFAGEWVAGSFKKAGIRYRRSDKPKSRLYLECLPLFARGQVNLPDHGKLLRELRLLERTTAPSGKDRVDHPKRGGSDDYANAACGALQLLAAPRAEAVIGWGSYSDPVLWTSKKGFVRKEEANPQSAPCTLVFPEEKPLPKGLSRRLGAVRLW
jgi:hypothetical protein